MKAWRSNPTCLLTAELQEHFVIWGYVKVERGRSGGVASQARLLSESTVPNHAGVAQPSRGQPDPG